MEEFLTGDIWGKVNKLFTNNKQKKFACIAYVTSDSLDLTYGDILICDVSDFAIKCGDTSAKTLATYLNRGVKIYSNSQLHSKLLITDSFLVIGSANLSKNSAERLTESSVVTTNEILLSGAKAFRYDLIEESILLTKENIDLLLNIEVIKRPSKPINKSKIREKEFGNCYWLVPGVFPISDKAYDKIKDLVDKTKKSIAERENIEEENIGLLKWRTKTEFSNKAKEGDQIVIIYNNKSKTRKYIYAPSTILKKETINGFTYFYHDDSKERKVSWKVFQTLKENMKLESNNFTRTRIISKKDINVLKQLWKKQHNN